MACSLSDRRHALLAWTCDHGDPELSVDEASGRLALSDPIGGENVVGLHAIALGEDRKRIALKDRRDEIIA